MVEPPLPLTPETPFAPLPLRPRGAMELLDTSVKLYRQYFGVLLSWSALIAAANLVSGIVSFFLLPIGLGAVACCLAAAVRGQRVTFKQCWEFTQPRYGALLGMSLLCTLILLLLVLPVVIGGVIAFVAGGAALGSASVLVLMGVIATIGALVLGSYATVWYYMVSMVVCFEDERRNTSSLGHAYQLLKGQWSRVLGITLLLSMIFLALLAIIGSILYLVGSGSEVVAGITSGSTKAINSLFTLTLSFTVLSQLVSMIMTPLFHLCVGTAYLDIRTRKEALDLQWAAHVAAPVASAINPTFLNAPGESTYQNTPYGYSSQGYNPQGYSPQAYNPQGPVPQNYPAQGYAPQSYPPSGYPAPDYGPQGYAPQQYAQNYAPQGYQAPTPGYAAPNSPPQSAPQQGYMEQVSSAPVPTQSGASAQNMAPPQPDYHSNPPIGSAPQSALTPLPFAAGPTTEHPTGTGTPSSTDAQSASFAFAPSVPSAPAITDVLTVPNTASAEVTCEQCGAVSPGGQRFCMTCGHELPKS